MQGVYRDEQATTTRLTRFAAKFTPTEGDRRLRKLLIVPFDAAAANQFDKLLQTRKLRKIGRADLLIASIALANRATLVTRNTRHFQQVRTST